MQLNGGGRDGESGIALVTALLCALVMLALGGALLSLVDAQAEQSGRERTRDRGFNLAEGVLTAEGFVLGRNWPGAAVTTGTGTVAKPLERGCSDPAAAVGGTLGAAAAPGSAAALLQGTLNASYTDGAFAGATWSLTVCDDAAGSTTWNDATLTDGTKNWDKNQNDLLWVRVQATVAGRARTVAGLVRARTSSALPSKYGLVTGNVAEDLSATTAGITNAAVLAGLTGGLLSTNPVAAADPAKPLPNSGVVGLRCGLLNDPSLQKSCVTGTIGALSAVPAVNALVTGGAYTQFPQTQAADAATIGQLRAQAKASGTYTEHSAGGAYAGAPPCTITGAPSASTVVFIEAVGTPDQWCVIDVGAVSRAYKALVIGNGRVIIRGDDNVNGPSAYSPSAPRNLFTGVVYALNDQTADKSTSTPQKTVVRVEQGARVRGGVYADGKNAAVSITPPDFHTATLVCAIVSCPSLLATTLQALALAPLVDTLVNGGCLVRVLTVCTLSLPPTPVATVLGAMNAQLTTYGAGIRSDVATVEALTVRGASGVVPGSFRDLNPTR